MLERLWLKLSPSAPPSSRARCPSPLLPTTRSVKPLPLKSPAKPVVGESPPVAKLWINGFAEPALEINVPLFDPALSVARPGPSPLKLPRKSAAGSWPTE